MNSKVSPADLADSAEKESIRQKDQRNLRNSREKRLEFHQVFAVQKSKFRRKGYRLAN
jgi:hypothetical protein